MNEQQQPTLPPALVPHKRIAALSVVGDAVWNISFPALEWMIEHGDNDLYVKAASTLNNWHTEQGWFIEWGNSTRYFELAELACRDLAGFKQMVKLAPAGNEGAQRIIELALMVGEQRNKPWGIGRKNILKRRKQRRGRRRK